MEATMVRERQEGGVRKRSLCALQGGLLDRLVGPGCWSGEASLVGRTVSLSVAAFLLSLPGAGGRSVDEEESNNAESRRQTEIATAFCLFLQPSHVLSGGNTEHHLHYSRLFVPTILTCMLHFKKFYFEVILINSIFLVCNELSIHQLI